MLNIDDYLYEFLYNDNFEIFSFILDFQSTINKRFNASFRTGKTIYLKKLSLNHLVFIGILFLFYLLNNYQLNF